MESRSRCHSSTVTCFARLRRPSLSAATARQPERQNCRSALARSRQRGHYACAPRGTLRERAPLFSTVAGLAERGCADVEPRGARATVAGPEQELRHWYTGGTTRALRRQVRDVRGLDHVRIQRARTADARFHDGNHPKFEREERAEAIALRDDAERPQDVGGRRLQTSDRNECLRHGEIRELPLQLAGLNQVRRIRRKTRRTRHRSSDLAGKTGDRVRTNARL